MVIIEMGKQGDHVSEVGVRWGGRWVSEVVKWGGGEVVKWGGGEVVMWGGGEVVKGGGGEVGVRWLSEVGWGG